VFFLFQTILLQKATKIERKTRASLVGERGSTNKIKRTSVALKEKEREGEDERCTKQGKRLWWKRQKKKFKKYLTYCTGEQKRPRARSQILLVSELHGLKTIKTYSTDIRPFFINLFVLLFWFIILFWNDMSAVNHSTTKEVHREKTAKHSSEEKLKKRDRERKTRAKNYIYLFICFILFYLLLDSTSGNAA